MKECEEQRQIGSEWVDSWHIVHLSAHTFSSMWIYRICIAMWLLAIGTNLVYCSNHLWVRKQIHENISPNKSCFYLEIHRQNERERETVRTFIESWRAASTVCTFQFCLLLLYKQNKSENNLIFWLPLWCILYRMCWSYMSCVCKPTGMNHVYILLRSLFFSLYLSMFDTNKITLRGTENNFGLAMWTQTHAVAKQLFALILVNLIQWQRLCMRNILHAQWLYLWVWRWIRNATRGSSTENTQFSVRDLLTFH